MENIENNSPPVKGVGEDTCRTDSGKEIGSNPYPAGQNKPLDFEKIEISETGKNVFEITLNGDKITLNEDAIESIKNQNIEPGLEAELQSHNIGESEFIAKVHLFDSDFSINETLKIGGHIRNGANGYIQYITNLGSKTKGSLENKDLICIFSADLKPVQIDHVPSVEVIFPDGRLITGSINEIVKIFKSEYHLTPAKMQRLREVFDAWYRFQIGHNNVEDRNRSPIFIQDGIVRCSYDVVKMSIEDILRRLREFYQHAKDPHHYSETMAWSIFAVLHFEMKNRATRLIQAPLIFTAGPSRTGKTSLGDLFIGHGFAQSRDQYFLPYNRVKTPYALMWNLSLSNLPRLIDEVPADFYVKNAANLKAYCQTGIFGDRGRGDPGVIQYMGMCSFITTTNDALRRDDDLALSNRNIIQYFTIKALSIQNKDRWKALYSALPEGFLFALFDVIFGGMAIEDIVRDVENFESSHDWITYVMDKINLLCDWFGIPRFPDLRTSELPETDNASEIAEAFISEWNRIEHGKDWFTDESGANIMKTNYRSPLDGELKVDERTDIEDGKPVTMWVIKFSGSAFKVLNKIRNLSMPYKTATEFLANISQESKVKVENEGKQKMVKINGSLTHCFQISLPIGKEGEE